MVPDITREVDHDTFFRGDLIRVYPKSLLSKYLSTFLGYIQ